MTKVTGLYSKAKEKNMKAYKVTRIMEEFDIDDNDILAKMKERELIDKSVKSLDDLDEYDKPDAEWITEVFKDKSDELDSDITHTFDYDYAYEVMNFGIH